MIWVRRIGVGAVVIVLVAIIALYGAPQVVIDRTYAIATTSFRAATAPATVAEGGRIARIVQCRECHGDMGKGRVFVDTAMLGRIGPPALARKVALYSDGELERLIRHGVKRDGTGAFIMPTESFSQLSDQDVAAVIGWLRTLKPASDDYTKPNRFGPLARAGVLGGGLKTNVLPATVAPQADRGRYFVGVACLQCHAMYDSRPSESTDQSVPPLAETAAAYDLPAFRRLLRTGMGASPRDLGAMKQAALEGLSSLHDDEVAAVHAYLVTEAAKPR